MSVRLGSEATASQEVVIYQPARTALSRASRLSGDCFTAARPSHGCALDILWASWVSILLRSDAPAFQQLGYLSGFAQDVFRDYWVGMLSSGGDDLDGLIEPFESLSIIDTRHSVKKRPTITRPARHHPYLRSASRQSTLLVRGRGKHIAPKTLSLWSEASEVAVVEQVSEPAPVLQPPQPEPASDALAVIFSSTTEVEQEFAASVPIPESPQLEPASPALAALPSSIIDMEQDAAALVPLPESPTPAPAPLALPAPLTLVALPPLETVEEIMHKAEQIMLQKQQQKLAQQAELPAAPQPALEPEQTAQEPEPLPTPTPTAAPAENDEEEGDGLEDMLRECVEYDADSAAYHASRA